MVDVFKLADAFIEHVLKTHRDQVALIGYYGSYATGTATPQSDLDLIYVPDNMESTQNLYNSFVIDGRPYEFWPISWERLERIAKAQEYWPVSAGLLMNLKILHHRSEEDLDRIKALKAITLELQTPEKKPEMVEKALDSFTLVLNNLGKLRLEVKKGHLTGVRWSGWEVVTSCVECLALANQTYFNKGWGSNHEELLKLKERPRELHEYIVDITTSDDPSEVLRISEQLAYETREIILESQREVAKPDAVESLFKDYYPGLREYVNKINSAVEEKMYIKANNAAARIHYDLAFCLSRGLTGLSHKDFNLYSELDDVYRKNNFPDLMNSIAPGESESLISKSKEFDEAVQNFFKKHGLSLNYVEGIEDLKRFFERRRKNVD